MTWLLVGLIGGFGGGFYVNRTYNGVLDGLWTRLKALFSKKTS